ncbi:hemerythrin domain-containing protein [Microvirga sp. GCM10011540]|uniref:hemerythrin domain-containing protein n=1 Tax=Microvirga sp. GCM10011540 TaxID=3317338 RepID=UPI003622D7F4
MDLWQMVLADHANIRELCREVLHATGGGPNSRAHLFEELDIEIERHFRAEEKVLYPALAQDQRTEQYLDELEQEHDEIRRRLDELASRPDKDSRSWGLSFNELTSTIRLHFSLEENGILTVARGVVDAREAEELRRAYEREKIASIQARRWHLPAAIMPERYGISTGTALGVLAGLGALWGVALAWRMSHQGQKRASAIRPVFVQPEPPFPLRSRIEKLGEHGAAGSFAGRQAAQSTTGPGGAAASHQIASGDSADGSSPNNWFSSANPPRAPSGISSGLQPGGVVPGGGPGASVGSVGTGGAQTENRDSGSLKRDGR